jgi:hypothetical protein
MCFLVVYDNNFDLGQLNSFMNKSSLWKDNQFVVCYFPIVKINLYFGPLIAYFFF